MPKNDLFSVRIAKVGLAGNKQGIYRTYDIGFCKPPKHSQFRKGQSGNPSGRKTGAISLKKALQTELRKNDYYMFKQILQDVFQGALNGQIEHLELVWDAMEKIREIKIEKTKGLTKQPDYEGGYTSNDEA